MLDPNCSQNKSGTVPVWRKYSVYFFLGAFAWLRVGKQLAPISFKSGRGRGEQIAKPLTNNRVRVQQYV